VDIRNGKLRIRNATTQDAKKLREWWNDGKVMAHAGFPNGLGISEPEIVEALERDNHLHRRLIIEFDDEPVGQMSYRTMEEKVVEIGIKICDASQQNKGYGTEFLKMLLKHIFMNMEYDKVILDTNLKNKRAQHVYERLGFRKTGTNVDSWRDQLGKFQSSVDYEMTKAEYISLYCNKGL